MKKVTAIKAKNIVGNNNLLKKPKVCAYCRVSTDSNKQMESLETQVFYYENYIKNKSGWEYAGVFKDEGISGTGTAKRTEFNKMIKACELGKIDLILTKSISRFSRNTADCLKTVRYLKGLKVAVYFERENINTIGANSELILSVLSSLAQDESKNISENTRWAFQKKFKQGRLQINAKRFLGYDVDKNGNLVINKEEAKIVKRIYKRYLNGDSLNEIKRGLEKSKIKTITGLDTWSGSTIKKILSNEKYYGDLIQQKTITVDYLTHKRKKNTGEVPMYEVKNHHEAIVSKEDFLKVQEIMRKKAAKFGNLPEVRNKYTQRYAFSGKIICGNCGATFKRRTWNIKKNKHIVWQCSTYINEGKNSCNMKVIKDEILKAVFVKMFNKLYERKDDFFKTFADNIDKVLKKNTKCENVFKLDREIDNINGEIKKLIRQQIKGELQDGVFDAKHRELNEELHKLKDSKDEGSFDSNKYKDILKRSKEIQKIIEMRKNTLIEFDDNIFKNLIEKIVVITPTHLEFYLKNGMKVEEEFTKK